MVRCRACENNCCNGGYGEVGGKPCTICPEVYQHQTVFLADAGSIVFARDDRPAELRGQNRGQPPILKTVEWQEQCHLVELDLLQVGRRVEK